MKVYKDVDVLTATRKRISMLFDNFKDIHVSISSGKDSCVLYGLALQEAIIRKRKIHVFFLDQEAEYSATVDIVRHNMSHKNVIPLWYQVPIKMTNSTSYEKVLLNAWGENEKWMREKEPNSIKEISGEYPDRFYSFFPWYEQQNLDAAYLVGLRAEEGILRYRAVTKFGGWNDLKWSTTTDNVHKFYPIYDWTVYDVWKFIYDFDIKYNKIYDLMFMDGYSLYSKMRISNLIHEKSYKCLVDLPRYEPETYNNLCKRLKGVATASRYASEKLVFNNKVLPKHYSSWLEFREFLVESLPNDEHSRKFRERFEKQEKNERTYQLQVGQLLINDFENSRGFDTKITEKKQKIINKWRKIL